MKPYVWNHEQDMEEQKQGAYWERNMLAQLLAMTINGSEHDFACGWYYQKGAANSGFCRVLSLWNGLLTFHIPDGFQLSPFIPEIEANWNGHTTEQKWYGVMDILGIQYDPMLYANTTGTVLQ